MRLLKIVAKGLPLFKEEVEIDFYAEQRVSENNQEMVSHCVGSIYTNNVISIVGINASGKTSLLKLISFVIEFVNGEPVNRIRNREILDGAERVFLCAYFYDPQAGIFKLESEIVSTEENDGEDAYVIGNERLWVKKVSKIKSKRDLFEFTNSDLHMKREREVEFLKDDTSIVLSLSKNKGFYLKDLIQLTNVNFLSLIGNFPHELIAFLDPNIESIVFEKKTGEARLKFYNRDEIHVPTPILFEQYLSSGTIKGFNIFLNAMRVLGRGGYLIVDELENHFNREIVATLIRFFMNEQVNRTGATLIFSTHYSELLDEFERNDGIYIVRNRNGIDAQKLSHVLHRNDIKKSEAFKSNFLQGTVPVYDAYINLKDAIIDRIVRE